MMTEYLPDKYNDYFVLDVPPFTNVGQDTTNRRVVSSALNVTTDVMIHHYVNSCLNFSQAALDLAIVANT